MKRFLALLTTLILTRALVLALATFFLAEAAQAAPVDTTKVDYAGVHFDFASQDGDLTYGCVHEILPASGDLAVMCSRANAPTDVWKFTVHLRLFKHERQTAPKLSYELLYWVTDEQLIGGKPGQFTGSTIWFRLAENVPLMSLEAGQDIENTMVLHVRINL